MSTQIDRAPSRGLAGLSPAYFGIVMATGIVSLAAHLLSMPRIALALFWLNIAAYAALWLLNLLRAVRYPARFFGDVADHLRGAGFFTIVAATSILGSQFVVLAGAHAAGTVFLAVALVLWLGLTYAIFASLSIKREKPALAQGISGAWLLAVVATHSITVLGALVAGDLHEAYGLRVDLLALSLWLAGAMLYVWIILLIFYRLMFFSLSAGDLSPTYWINMGAMAISTLAGALLILNASASPLLASLLPFIEGLTLLSWATATWWIPMLAVLFVWRHAWRKVPLEYDPQWWGAVFPLGMYAACTEEMLRALQFDFIAFLPPVFLYLALAAWALAMVGMVRGLLRPHS